MQGCIKKIKSDSKDKMLQFFLLGISWLQYAVIDQSDKNIPESMLIIVHPSLHALLMWQLEYWMIKYYQEDISTTW